MSKKTVRMLVVAFVVIAILYTTIILADFNLILQGKTPKFIIHTYQHTDTLTTEYTGLGYKFIAYEGREGKEHVKMGTLFLSYDASLAVKKEDEKKANTNTVYNMSGTVTDIQKKDGKVELLVESTDAASNYDKLYIRVIDGTLIYRNDYKAKKEDIQIGSKVQVKTSSIITKSYPGQTVAEIINIIE